MNRPPPRSTLFPNTPLSQSSWRFSTTACNTSSRPVIASVTSDSPFSTATADASCQVVPFGWKSPLPNVNRVVPRSEEHTSELQSRQYLVCRLLLEKKKKKQI